MNKGVALLAAIAAVTMTAATPTAPTLTVIGVGGHPFMALPSADGTTLFVSVFYESKDNGIQVVERSGSDYKLGKFITVDGLPSGLALTPDGKTLLIASEDRYAALSATEAEAGGTPHVTYLQDRFVAGAIEVTSSADGRFAFFTNENDDSVGVVRVGSNADGGPSLAAVGRIQVDRAPVGMSLSPDGGVLYVTSEAASAHPHSCSNDRPAGSLTAIDALAAETAPGQSIISATEAGCSPVRVAVSPDGARVWVTQRGDDTLSSFDAAVLRSDPEHARRTSLRVGANPVGLTLARSGTLAFVANSNRFDRSARNSTVDVIDLEKGVIIASLPTGAFPRELRESPLHDVVYLTNYNGGTVEALPVP
jgi:DNA-binding beta-propeller fold protein YncE